MEFFYFCLTCSSYRRDVPAGTPFLLGQKRWCIQHRVSLPAEVGEKHLICCDFSPKDARATEWKQNIEMFPKGELWSFPIYSPFYKFIEISELPKVDPETGEVISL